MDGSGMEKHHSQSIDATDILAQWEAICEAATKGDWLAFNERFNDWIVYTCPTPRGRKRMDSREDAEFCAAARAGWPAAIRALRVAREALMEASSLREPRAQERCTEGAGDIDRILEGRDDVS